MAKAKTTLKLTLEEYGYKLSDLIYPSKGIEMAIEEAMKRHAEFYHESKVKKLRLSTVVWQSELLKAFADYVQGRMWEGEDKDLSEFIEEFLSL